MAESIIRSIKRKRYFPKVTEKALSNKSNELILTTFNRLQGNTPGLNEDRMKFTVDDVHIHDLHNLQEAPLLCFRIVVGLRVISALSSSSNLTFQ